MTVSDDVQLNIVRQKSMVPGVASDSLMIEKKHTTIVCIKEDTDEDITNLATCAMGSVARTCVAVWRANVLDHV